MLNTTFVDRFALPDYSGKDETAKSFCAHDRAGVIATEENQKLHNSIRKTASRISVVDYS
jgi:hypothetical protein|tara:strand:+ start:358 stop:537 length:180 start_codon:yes stop_codon:yes gene_type:complete